MRNLRWSIILPFWFVGVVTGVMAAYTVTKGFESTLYLITGILGGVVIGKLASARPFVHGFLSAAGGFALDGIAQFTLWPIYVARAPEVIARSEAIFGGVDLLTIGWILLVPMSCLAGGLVGLIAWVADMALPASSPQEGAGHADEVSELTQKRFVERRSFRLESDRIRCTSKDADGEVEFFVDYEDLTPQRNFRVEQSPFVYYAAISASVFSVVGLIAVFLGAEVFWRWIPLWALAAFVFWGFHIVRRRRYLLIQLSEKKALYFLNAVPTQLDVEQFITSMFLARKRYLRSQYLEIDFGNNRQREVAKFEWLLREGAISNEEFESIKVKLL